MTAPGDPDRLFVYGLLRKDFSIPIGSVVRQNADFIGMASFHGLLFDLGDYPGAVPSVDTGNRVFGEVYRIRDKERILALLDRYEECAPERPAPTEFRRAIVTVDLEKNGAVTAWAYLYNRSTEGLARIVSGDYEKYPRHGER